MRWRTKAIDSGYDARSALPPGADPVSVHRARASETVDSFIGSRRVGGSRACRIRSFFRLISN